MDRAVYLFGLHHCDQRPRLDEPGESLRKRLRTEMLTRGVELVGEEDDPASHLGRSIADELAKDLAEPPRESWRLVGLSQAGMAV